MAMAVTSRNFKRAARAALGDPNLARALARMPAGFRDKRQAAKDALPEFDTLRDEAQAIRDRTLTHLDHYLTAFEARAHEAGSQVHWAGDDGDAREIVLAICRRAGARTATKGKSMVAEEIGLNDALAEAGVTPVETDLGEYILQLRDEPPSHIVAPAFHLSRSDVETAFRAAHGHLDASRALDTPAELLAEARRILRTRFVQADVGITGANQLIAETGGAVLVTNEGNGDLTQTLPDIHIVLASLEKVVPTLEDSATLLRLLARSATGQAATVYTSFTTGPRRPGEADGPREVHIVLVDNGRSSLLGGDFQAALRCIRCGACINHCPIYAAVGGHAYGSPYPGPIGAVLTPALAGLEHTRDLPEASSLCGRCEAVCPVNIPIPSLLRKWRERADARGVAPATQRWGVRAWAAIARRPRLYRQLVRPVLAALVRCTPGGAYRRLPLAGGWTSQRDFPAPQAGQSFLQQWQCHGRG